MRIYYCHKCAIQNHLLGNEHTSSLLGSSYQIEKYMKHTIPSTYYKYASIFDNPSTSQYKNYIVDATCAGSVEIDDYQRKNIIWISTGKIGNTYKNGSTFISNDTLKIVFSTDPDKIHAFPESSTRYTSAKCCICGTDIIT